jgi:RNA polymerase sigma factor (sigma-70 family)
VHHTTPATAAQLLDGCLHHDPDAWTHLIDRYGRLIWTIARGYRLTEADAEDVRQQTWLALLRHGHTIRDPARLGDWLATVARREALKTTRRTRPVPVDLALLDAAAGHDESAEHTALRSLQHAELIAAVNRLPTAQSRTLLRMALADPPASYDQIAAALDLAPASVGPLRTRYLRQLRHNLTDTAASAEAGP